MAHRRSALKKIRADQRRREQNIRVISELKTVKRKTVAAVAAKKTDAALAQVRILFSKLDKAVKKGILHKNTASRAKSRISKKINGLKA